MKRSLLMVLALSALLVITVLATMAFSLKRENSSLKGESAALQGEHAALKADLMALRAPCKDHNFVGRWKGSPTLEGRPSKPLFDLSLPVSLHTDCSASVLGMKAKWKPQGPDIGAIEFTAEGQDFLLDFTVEEVNGDLIGKIDLFGFTLNLKKK